MPIDHAPRRPTETGAGSHRAEPRAPKECSDFPVSGSVVELSAGGGQPARSVTLG